MLGRDDGLRWLTVMASVSVFANGVDHCLSLAAGVRVDDHRRPPFAARRANDSGRRQLYCVAVWRRIGERALISMRVAGAPHGFRMLGTTEVSCRNAVKEL